MELAPDLVTFCAGGNDILRPGSDPDAVAERFEAAVADLTGRRRHGAGLHRLRHPWRPRAQASARQDRHVHGAVRAIADRYGCPVLDLWSLRSVQDRRAWNGDRLHLSPEGHTRVALRAGQVLGLEVPADPDQPWPPQRRAAARGAAGQHPLGARVSGAVDRPPAARRVLRRPRRAQAPGPAAVVGSGLAPRAVGQADGGEGSPARRQGWRRAGAQGSSPRPPARSPSADRPHAPGGQADQAAARARPPRRVGGAGAGARWGRWPWSVTSTRAPGRGPGSSQVIFSLSVCRTALVNSSVTTSPASSRTSAATLPPAGRARTRPRASATEAPARAAGRRQGGRDGPGRQARYAKSVMGSSHSATMRVAPNTWQGPICKLQNR